MSIMRKALAALAAAFIIVAPLAARAQIAPSYSDQAYDGSGEAQIHGRILAFDGGYEVEVRDERGYVDHVRLHQGTIINPTGLTLAPGMVVSIMGYNAGSFFAANEIDTPYTFYYGRPYYGGHPWDYYGPTVGLSFFFGNPGWWHGGYFGGGPRFVGGVRYYNNVHVNTFYRGGGFEGRNYVVPRERGGYFGGGRGPVDTGRRYGQGDHGGGHGERGGERGGGHEGRGGDHGGHGGHGR
jgi:hypothetical protein